LKKVSQKLRTKLDSMKKTNPSFNSTSLLFLLISSPPPPPLPPLPYNKGTINNYRCHYHDITALPNALLLLLKLCFSQNTTSAVKLVTAALLPLLQPLAPRCQRRNTTA
jgi:hypothetical protein